MARKKKFREWYEEQDEEVRYRKKDKKRYDSKRSNIQEARRQKKSLKNSFFDG